MAATYKTVLWNRHKRVYDGALFLGIAIFLGVFMAVAGAMNAPSATTSPEILFISALGACAFTLLHVVLAIGPLARLSPRFLPLLYNRRHFGVVLFLVGLSHAALATVWYHGFGVLNPIVSALSGAGSPVQPFGIPFELFGAGALVILFLMAATSHDFWLANLGPSFWKGLHMGVYAAYGLLVLHVLFGVVQDPDVSPLAAGTVGIGFVVLAWLHLAAGFREAARDKAIDGSPRDAWIDAGLASAIPENRARVVTLSNGERIAVFRYDGKVAAVSNVCAHQLGPLGEGRVVDGCITCPWHGYQYRPEDGCSPPPYTEKIETYAVRLENGRVFVDPKAKPKGTPVTPAVIGGAA
ncbi:MAG: Rieske 2Fe-2S domain-containing protein [Alphaproteobacteria bacterium]|nr:Rieske 2Fe-2S domain-containing protein [Alphaproteobacteria bacterium]